MTREHLFQYMSEILGIEPRQVEILVESRSKSHPNEHDGLRSFVEEVLYKTNDRTLDFYWYQYQESGDLKKIA